jgi:hypothetical protein
MDKHISPVGWYVGTYLLRFVELEQQGNFEEDNRFLCWENTVLVKAKDKLEAYDKIEAIGKEHDYPYKGGKEAIDVQWIYEGITEIIAVYDELEDGSELYYSESRRKLKNIKKLIGKKDDFHR